jgi:hypothetical protein
MKQRNLVRSGCRKLRYMPDVNEYIERAIHLLTTYRWLINKMDKPLMEQHYESKKVY